MPLYRYCKKCNGYFSTTNCPLCHNTTFVVIAVDPRSDAATRLEGVLLQWLVKHREELRDQHCTEAEIDENADHIAIQQIYEAIR